MRRVDLRGKKKPVQYRTADHRFCQVTYYYARRFMVTVRLKDKEEFKDDTGYCLDARGNYGLALCRDLEVRKNRDGVEKVYFASSVPVDAADGELRFIRAREIFLRREDHEAQERFYRRVQELRARDNEWPSWEKLRTTAIAVLLDLEPTRP